MLSYTLTSPSIDVSRPYLMDSDTLYPTSSPAASGTLKTPFSNRSQFYEADGTDDEVSLNGRPKDTSRSKSGKPQANLDSD
jgi:hypothetical protein